MNEILATILTGLISGVISSVLFFCMMSMLRPHLTISGDICKGVDDIGVFYAIKILNHSKYDVIDLKIELILKTPFNSNGGLNHSMEWINLRRDKILLLPRYKKDDKHGDYALVVATRDNLEQMWTNNAQFVEVKVHGKHCFSGIRKSFDKKYYTKRSTIKDGMFNFGKTFDIS